MSKDEMRFEEAYGKLEDILEKMTGDEVPLDESVALYAKAAELIAICHQKLENAQLQIEEIDAKMKVLEEEE